MAFTRALLLAALLQHGIAMPVFSPNPKYLAVRDLTASSSCDDLPTDLIKSNYDAVDSHNHLQDFINRHPSETRLMADYAMNVGLLQSVGVCSVDKPCARPECTNLKDPKAAFSAASYNGLVSMVNVNQVFSKMYDALGLARGTFNSLQQSLQNKYYPGTQNAKENELMKGFSIALSVIGIFAKGEYADVALNAISTTLDTINDLSTGDSDTKLEDLAASEENANDWVANLRKALVTTNDDLLNKGSTDGVGIQDVINGGGFLDWRTIPILNSQKTIDDLGDAMYLQLLSNVVNFAWKKQRTFLMSFPMTEDEFNSRSTEAGSNDHRLKMYYGGRGWFFQSMQEQNNGILPSNPVNINPPGWGELQWEPSGGISTHDIIMSSADAYNMGGFDFDVRGYASELLKTKSPQDIQLPAIHEPGVFTLPHCQMDSGMSYTPDLDRFFGLLYAPNSNFGGNKIGNVPSFCFCMGIQDKNGKTFGEATDFRLWERYCTQDQPSYDPGPTY